jgi:hypothetical protein
VQIVVEWLNMENGVANLFGDVLITLVIVNGLLAYISDCQSCVRSYPNVSFLNWTNFFQQALTPS